MAISVPVDNTVVEEQDFDNTPLPEGTKVLATILPSLKDGVTIITRPFAKQGLNVNIPALAIRFRINDGQKGKGRNLFADIPLARKFAATGAGKFPDGSPAYSYFGFFRALGYDPDAAGGLAINDERELIGREIELQLTIDTSGATPRNEVRFFNKANGIPAQPAPAVTVPAAWTPGGLPAAAAPAAPQAWSPPQAAAQQAPAAGWTPPPAAPQPTAQPQYAQPAQQQQYAQPVAQGLPYGGSPTPAVQQQPWSPNQADVQYAQAQAQQGAPGEQTF
jgi:hypothetical protein